MKRRHPTFDLDSPSDCSVPRKRYSRVMASSDTLPCKFKLLRAWQLTETASRFISKANKMDDQALRDRSNPQMAVVLYEPNLSQHIIDAITAAEEEPLCHSDEPMYQPEPMEIESLEIYSV